MNINAVVTSKNALRSHGDHGVSSSRHLITAAAISITWMVVLCATFNPKWETNDDVAMSMVAHGYGIADYGSAHLFFSNVLWGVIVRSLPSINGILGYSVATMLSLTLAGAAIVYFLLRLAIRPIFTVLVLIVVFMRPTLFPQFTETAGLLAVGGVLGLLSYQRRGSVFDLVAACCLAFLAYLIRDLELALVAAVGLPLLPWRKLIALRSARLAAVGLAICLGGATVANVRAYSSPEWQTFRQQNFARAPLTDFDATKFILERPELMQRHGLSPNDVRLVSNWFFVDPRLSNPDLLRSLLSEIPPQAVIERNFASSLTAFSLPLGPNLLTLTLTGLALLIILLRPSLLAAWLICFAFMLGFALAGRSPPVRVCFPLFALLTTAAVTMQFRLPQWRRLLLAATLLVGSLFNAWHLIDEAAASDRTIALARHPEFVSPRSTFVWGDALPFESVFPVFTREYDVRSTRIYGFGVLTLAPFSVAVADEAANRGFLAQLQSNAGIPLIAKPAELALLSVYCMENFATPLQTSIATQAELWTVVNASCTSPADE
ncbi:hypothetical protein [Bradyrhizobium sp. GM2.2]|uniref:hypothetical protein n=1 Tax=Bradyrhizobium sp. GM2.2 TaxID=3156358 RepID=UPI00339ADB98